MGSQAERSAAPPQQATPPAAACLAAAAYFCFTTSAIFCWLIFVLRPNHGTSVRDLDKRLRRHGPAARAAFLIEEAQNLAQRIGIRRIPEKCPDPADVHQAGLVNVRRVGTFLWYSANTDSLREVLSFLYEECCTRSRAVAPQSFVEISH